MEYTFEQLTTGEQKIISMAKEAYIQVMGEEKWGSLTEKEKHDAVMMILKGFSDMIAMNPN